MTNPQQQRYNRLSKKAQDYFWYLKARNPSLETSYRKLSDKQLLDMVERSFRKVDSSELNRRASRPRIENKVFKWQRLLKKDKKDMRVGRVYPSDRAGKKIMMLTHEGKKIHAGAKGYGNYKGKGKNRGGGTHTNKKRRANFKARHNCDQCKGRITTPKCLACKKLW
tara:strand:- start:156 stop:656 length:501 start_codon:yes stop_codon:yes gene_type:complete